MKLEAVGLQLEIRVTDRTCDPSASEPYDDWLKCEARIVVPSFAGVVHWQAQAIDFRRFRDQLLAMDDSVGDRCVAQLAPLEPGVRLNLQMQLNGQIAGEYEFTDYDGFGPDAPVLTGDFVLDQTFLRPLIRDLDSILQTNRATLAEE